MATYKILSYPDFGLKRIGKRVEVVDDHIREIIDNMFETHYNTENCAALAATQLDIPDAPAITVIDFSDEKNQPLCLINPEIIEREGEDTELEGCMSVFPSFFHDKVTRATKIKVRALDRDGKSFEFGAEGFMAKCIQHEIDHLQGRVFLDHLSPLKRKLADKKLDKIKRLIKQKTNHKEF